MIECGSKESTAVLITDSFSLNVSNLSPADRAAASAEGEAAAGGGRASQG